MTGLIFHLIPHTHWDREWYLPRAALQARLVAVTDDLIERLLANPGYRSFRWTGQTSASTYHGPTCSRPSSRAPGRSAFTARPGRR